MTVMSKIRKQRGVAVITIPSALLTLMNLDVGAEVELSVECGKLIAQPATPPRRRYALAELLVGAAAIKDLNAEIAWAQEGDPVGHEVA